MRVATSAQSASSPQDVDGGPTALSGERRFCAGQRVRRVYVPRGGRHEPTPTIMSAAQVQELAERMLKSSRRRIDVSQPFVDAMLRQGHRLHVVLAGDLAGVLGGEH